MTWRRSLALAVAATAVIPGWLTGAVAAHAADNGQARVRLLSTLTMGPKTDFYVDGRKLVSAVDYKSTTTYLNVSPGQHSLQLRPAGAAASSAPLADTQQTLAAGSYSTIISIEEMDMSVKELLVSDGIATPPSGSALVRFLHMCYQIPTVSLGPPGGAAIISNIAFTQASPYVPVQAGPLDLQLRQTDKPDNVVYQVSNVDLKAGSVQSFVGLGGMGQPVEALDVLDAASAGTAPQGGATTGEGGLVYGRAPALGLLACSLLLAAGLLVAGGRAAHRG
jgi:hypothetical protein